MRLALLLCGALALPAAADPFDEAVAAFRAGDAARAAALFHDLAVAGDADAQFNLALLYAEGAGLPLSPREALYWGWLAQLAGVAPAVRLTARLQGDLPPAARDALAQRLETDLRPRIAAGDSAAMLGLARILTELRAKPDPETAYAWLAIAAALGQPGAAAARDAALAGLPETKRFEVQERALSAFADWCREAEAPAASCAATG